MVVRPWSTAFDIAEAVTSGQTSAVSVISATLDAIHRRDPQFNSFTAITAERALARAQSIDDATSTGRSAGPLAAVPFAVKNLFDVKDLITLAGSIINREKTPASADAVLIERLEAAGAILVGTLNMGEYACDLLGENAHFGPTRNPHDTARITGGSSGGSAAAVAGGLVPISLGSDTNGSIRVPASLCGLFGLKPTYGRLSRIGAFPFVSSFDHFGLFGRTTLDVALAYHAMRGDEPAPNQSISSRYSADRQSDGLRVALADFGHEIAPAIREALELVTAALGGTETATLPETERARAAAISITAAEGAALHLDRLRRRPGDFGPAARARLIAGALTPAVLVQQAQRFRRWYREQVLALFEIFDVIVIPATPCFAPLIGQETFQFGDDEVPIRPNIGMYTQPISFIGLPALTVPIPLKPMPIGVQLVAAPWRESVLLQVARTLEQMGVVSAPRPELPAT